MLSMINQTRFNLLNYMLTSSQGFQCSRCSLVIFPLNLLATLEDTTAVHSEVKVAQKQF